MNAEIRSCPHCGAQLPEVASFCPHCAQDIKQRREVSPPRHMPRWALYSALMVLAALLLARGLYLRSRPQVCDNGTAEILYTDGGVTYQVLAGWLDDRFDPAHQVYQPVDVSDMLYTFPQCLYINHPESGANAKDEFMEKVERVTAAFVETDSEELPWTCDEPVPRPDYAPEAALVSSIHYYSGSGQGTLQWTIEMKNGDFIHLYQAIEAHPLEVYRFTPEDTPLNTVEEVQALLDSLNEITGGGQNTVDIHLPPVTYDGGITIPREINLYGAEEGGRTVFTGPIRIPTSIKRHSWIYDIDLVGDGSSVGLSASSSAFLLGCRISGWRTGVLVQDAWVSAFECTFEDNGIGLHYNADTAIPMSSHYRGNIFRNNDTGILFERVPNRMALSFPEVVFSGNGTDIDNRCGLELDLSEAVFD